MKHENPLLSGRYGDDRIVLATRYHWFRAIVPFVVAFSVASASIVVDRAGLFAEVPIVLAAAFAVGAASQHLRKIKYRYRLAATAAIYWIVVGSQWVVVWLQVGPFVWAMFQAIVWWRTTLVVTDERIYQTADVFSLEIDEMPLRALTDLRTRKPFPFGRLFNFGTFFVESAGQKQALSTIRYVREPERFYRLLQQQLSPRRSR